MAKKPNSRTPRTIPRLKSPAPASPRNPDVLVDFEFHQGLFFISVSNIGDTPALKVRIRFDKKFRGLNGTQDISSLPLFRNIEFLAPHKHITTFLDTSAAYFRRKEPTKLQVKIVYKDSANKTHSTTIQHDLHIYEDLVYLPQDIKASAVQEPGRVLEE